MKANESSTTKTTTTTNREVMKLETRREIKQIPLQMVISITSPAKDNKEVAKLTIPFVSGYSRKGVKCKENVITDSDNKIVSSKIQEYGQDDGVLCFYPSDDSQTVQPERSEWAKGSSYLRLTDKLLIQGIAENLRLVLCSDNKVFDNLEMKGQELADFILSFNPTRIKSIGEKGNAKDSRLKQTDILADL